MTVVIVTVAVEVIKGRERQCVPSPLVLAVRRVVFGELVGSSFPAQQRPTVTGAPDHQLHAVP